MRTSGGKNHTFRDGPAASLGLCTWLWDNQPHDGPLSSARPQGCDHPMLWEGGAHRVLSLEGTPAGTQGSGPHGLGRPGLILGPRSSPSSSLLFCPGSRSIQRCRPGNWGGAGPLGAAPLVSPGPLRPPCSHPTPRCPDAAPLTAAPVFMAGPPAASSIPRQLVQDAAPAGVFLNTWGRETEAARQRETDTEGGETAGLKDMIGISVVQKWIGI